MSNTPFFDLVTLATVGTMVYLANSVSKNVQANEQGYYLLSMHKAYKLCGYASLILGIVIGSFIFFSNHDLASYCIITALFLFFAIMGILCLKYFYNHYVLFNEEKIEVRTVGNRIHFFEWQQIQSARFNPTSGNLKLKCKDGRTFKIHQHLKGISVFLDRLKVKTSVEVKLPHYFN